MYLFAKDRSSAGDVAAAGVTASMVAIEVGVHANVARHHLDKLVAGGYLEVVSAEVAGAGAGRPSKRYIVVGDALAGGATQFPVRSDDLLLSLLGRALDRLSHDEAEMIAEEVGQEYGRNVAEGATDHPVICAVDSGMVKGRLAALVAASDVDALVHVVTESSVARSDTYCSTSV